MSVTYQAVLPVPMRTVDFVVDRLQQRWRRVGARPGGRKLSAVEQVVMALRWFVDGTRIEQLAVDNAIGLTTAYDRLHEVIDTLAEYAPSLVNVLIAAKLAGYEYVMIDGTLIRTDRVREPGPTPGVDLWWSGKHHAHGANIQVVTAPDGFPVWTSPQRPGREHDTTALRAHADDLVALQEWVADDREVLADLGYEGERDTMTVAVKKPKGGELTDEQKTANKAHNRKRAVGERGNALLKTAYKALRRVSLCPRRVGAITAAALILLQVTYQRTI